MRRHRKLTALAVLALLVASCNGSGTSEQTKTTSGTSQQTTTTSGSSGGANGVTFVMTEFGFEPAAVEVSAGETYEFTFVNEGQIEHEARLDTVHGVEDHIAGGHEGHEHGDGPLALLVQPGESGTLTVTFDEDAHFEVIACTLPGHYEAGMVATVAGLEVMSDDPGDHDGPKGEVTTFDQGDMEAVAGQAQVLGVLTGIDFVDTAGFHGMSEALGEGEMTGRELGSVDKVITAITSISWPHELEETTASFLADLEALAAGLEAEDVDAAAEAAHTVHESQHGFSHDVYAFLAGNGGHND